MKRTASVALCLTLAALATLALPGAAQDKWSFDVAPYLWVASFGAETSLPPNGAGPASNVQEFDTRISGGFMIAAQARYRSVGVLVDFNWLQLNTESLNPGPLLSGVDMRSDYIYSTAALTYALPLHGKFHAEVMAGARLWNVATDLELKIGGLTAFESSQSQTWVSPLVGVDLRYDLTRHWLLLGRGTVGGFSDSSIQWDVYAGVGYQFSDWCLATIGYRYLHEEYTKDRFTFNAEAQGFLLGVGFQF
jgi:opacity protein-like surface antigen